MLKYHARGRVLRKAILCILLLLVSASPALAQYNIHLKNGAVIKWVEAYTVVDDEIMFRYAGGTVGVPMGLVEKIEKTRTFGIAPRTAGPLPPAEPAAAMELPRMAEQADTGPIKQQIAELDQRLAEIGRMEADYKIVKDEYDHIRFRIQVLFQKGVAAARSSGGDPSKWYLFLQRQDREWTQLNTMRKKELKKTLERLDEEMKPILDKKDRFLKEKQLLQDELRLMEGP